ncbi:MAG: hypothetical protein LBP65_02085 [Puniceicoccales bacterium]|jgi:hypothetical protein|nr:hypothetical protein [Puniceicoccales bacterium]
MPVMVAIGFVCALLSRPPAFVERLPAVVDVVLESHRTEDFAGLPFRRRSEPFHGHLLHRTDATKKDGLYAIVLLRNAKELAGTTMELELRRLGNPEPCRTTVSIGTDRAKFREIWVGFTKITIAVDEIVAWRVRFLRGNEIVAEKSSFLFVDGSPWKL